jgi:hypothetical protein
VPFRVRSLVGLIPLYAIERLEGKWIESFDVFRENLKWFMTNRREIVDRCVTTVQHGGDFTHVLAVVDRNQLLHLLARVVDPDEFHSDHGMRSLSKFHQEHPFTFGDKSVGYEPGDAISRLKGGNSNWRGPVWMPTSFLMIESLRKLERAFGSSIRVSLGGNGEPTTSANPSSMTDTRAEEGIGAGSTASEARARGMSISTAAAAAPSQTISLSGLAARMADGLIHIFVPDEDGYRPVNGPRGTRKAERFAHDPHWRDLILFYEYFHGDTAEGLGASHQTGWTALVANLIDEWRM